MPITEETRARQAEARRRWWALRTDAEREAYAANQRKPHPKTSEALRGKPRPGAVGKRRTSQRVPCSQCGKEIARPPYLLAKFPHQFCSRSCMGAYYSVPKTQAIAVTCCQCGKEMQRTPGRVRRSNGNYLCSRACVALWRSGENHHNWKGGRHLHSDGYVMVKATTVPDDFRVMLSHGADRILEHRLVMAQHLGRPLEDWEVVHHKNGVRDDNRIENLELHSHMAHNGITNADRKDVAALRRENAALRQEIEMLKQQLTISSAELRATPA